MALSFTIPEPSYIIGDPIPNGIVLKEKKKRGPKPKITTAEDIDEGIEDILGSATPDGKFKIHCRRVLITYKTWLDKTAITEFFIKEKAELIRVAHEIGTKKIDYEHSHVFVDFGKQIHRSDSRCWDFNGIHPNIKPINRKKHLNRIYKYMCKFDHSNDDMLTWVTEVCEIQDIWDCQTITDAVKGVRLTEVMGAIAAWGLKPHYEQTPDPWEFQWQSDVEQNITTKLSPKRKIFWYTDVKGGMGKTDFARGMYVRYPNDTLIFTHFGGARDAATVICNALDTGWSGKYCIVDLPRDAETKALYEPMECIKNGMITATKYQGKTKIWKSGWLIIMANFNPEYGHISPDRWELVEMNEDPYYKLKVGENLEIKPNPHRRMIEEETTRNVRIAYTEPVVVPIPTEINAISSVADCSIPKETIPKEVIPTTLFAQACGDWNKSHNKNYEINNELFAKMCEMTNLRK